MSYFTSATTQLQRLLDSIDGAYAPNTIRAFRADFEEFIRFCESTGEEALPARPESVASFVGSSAQRGLASASIRRRIVSIGSVHRLLELPDPTKAGCLKLAVRKMHWSLGGVAPIKPDTLPPFGHGCTALVTSFASPYVGATRCSH